MRVRCLTMGSLHVARRSIAPYNELSRNELQMSLGRDVLFW